eukprot:CAMPEP_0171527186 /NCGR_PEP_ID=MMETSP0959-20130129/10893_1 /TAXON_ID=87120 /ORGANISM="Aurantiochytrium limacinum, Strain ATCCMYA-1381" /LENGTH=57 /DNA_ID=CAMNT_0012068861 /DNA_START=272 /DNA_END=442 /DNA_ORIENTATION=+
MSGVTVQRTTTKVGVDLASTADVAGVVGVIEGKLAGCKNNAYLRVDIINHVGWAIGE